MVENREVKRNAGKPKKGNKWANVENTETDCNYILIILLIGAHLNEEESSLS